MTLVAQGNNWWIESFAVARAVISNQAERVTTHTLERAGVLIGASATQMHDIAVADVTGLCLVLRATDDTDLVIGENITALESVFMNDTGNSRNVGEFVMVVMRKG